MKLSYILSVPLTTIIIAMVVAEDTVICLSNPEVTIKAGSIATAMLVQFNPEQLTLAES